MKEVFSILILACGAFFGWFYLRTPRFIDEKDDTLYRALRTGRPWRRLGAAVCVVVSIMFVLGIWFIDDLRSPRAFAAFWLVLSFLVLWLCGLAAKDILHTRRVVAKWRAERNGKTDPPCCADEHGD